jgi:hypothetical protein
MTTPTTARELQELLEQRNLYPWYAAANGTEPHDGYTLRKEGNEWVTYSYGPAAIPKERRFGSEGDAVRDLIDRLKNDRAFASYVTDL